MLGFRRQGRRSHRKFTRSIQILCLQITECLYLYQEPSVDHPHGISVPSTGNQISPRRTGPKYRREWWAKFNTVSGVVLPSTLKPGLSPVKPYGLIEGQIRDGTLRRNKRCPLCGYCFVQNSQLKSHFLTCARRNGNPQGYYWNGTLNDERRIGKETGELYCTRDRGEERDEALTSDRSSRGDPHTVSYEPSTSNPNSQPPSSNSLAVRPGLCHDRNSGTEPSPQIRTGADRGHGAGVIDTSDQELANSAVDSLQTSKEGRAGSPSKAAQVSGSV